MLQTNAQRQKKHRQKVQAQAKGFVKLFEFFEELFNDMKDDYEQAPELLNNYASKMIDVRKKLNKIENLDMYL